MFGTSSASSAGWMRELYLWSDGAVVVRWVRLRFNVNIGNYKAGEIYDVLNTWGNKQLVDAKYAEVVPYID